MSADGTRVAIGARLNDGNGTNSGHVRIYEFVSSAASWFQVGQDIDGEVAADESGYSVAMSADGSMSADGKRVAIGAILNDGNGNTFGYVRIYGLVDAP